MRGTNEFKSNSPRKSFIKLYIDDLNRRKIPTVFKNLKRKHGNSASKQKNASGRQSRDLENIYSDKNRGKKPKRNSQGSQFDKKKIEKKIRKIRVFHRELFLCFFYILPYKRIFFRLFKYKLTRVKQQHGPLLRFTAGKLELMFLLFWSVR